MDNMEMRLKQTKRDTDDIPPQHSFADQEERDIQENLANTVIILSQGF